ncbi:cupin domain-containing protein [Sorangium sp. So ce291]|uniref:cupin domain-containing protein n=1 Tax=Sorangium sp. So ce291 TaxID=3133294 RepID=UPI003F5FF7C2
MNKPGPVIASDVPPRARPAQYPEPFASGNAGRQKQALGEVFGLVNLGVNRTTLKPGGMSALRHWHSVADEFIYILSGHPTLITDAGETVLHPGMCMGFKGGDPDGHHLVNRSTDDVVYLEIGDRLPGDSGSYPDDDLKAVKGADGRWQFQNKDGAPY